MHHIGIVHMDMNWSNVLWNTATRSVCVNDFDLAHDITNAPLPCHGTPGMCTYGDMLFIEAARLCAFARAF